MKLLKFFFLLLCFFYIKNIYSQIFFNFKIKESVDIEIVKIDSTQDYYMIYANSNNLHYKIITRKCPLFERNIEVSKKYTVTIASLNNNRPDPYKLINPCDVSFGFEEGNYIYNETEWGCDIYYVYEILGLYYSTNKIEIFDYYNYLVNNPLTPQKRIGQ
jgi:hypothetical protein